MADEPHSTSVTVTQRRWPGVLLNVLVPGLGLLRAGKYSRGVFWFLGMIAAQIAVGLLFIMPFVPVIVAWIGLGVAVLLYLFMWGDGFRPGRMSGRLWVLLIVMIGLIFSLPSPISLVVRSFVIPTSGMEPTLVTAEAGKPADYVMVNRLAYLFAKPKRGDVIVFDVTEVPGIKKDEAKQDEKDVHFLRRIVGLPGEQIHLLDGAVYANGKRLGPQDGLPEVTYLHPPHMGEGTNYQLGENEYFVLGDNSMESYDSRYWGPVPAKALYGKVSKIYYPMDRMGNVK